MNLFTFENYSKRKISKNIVSWQQKNFYKTEMAETVS